MSRPAALSSRLSIFAIIAIAFAVFGGAPRAWAQEHVASVYDGQAVLRTRVPTTAPAATGINIERLALAMLLVLGLIVALRYAAGWLFPGVRAGVAHRGVRVLGRTPIAPRQQVMLLHVGRRVLVVGDSAGTLSSLANIDEPDEVAELLGQAGAAEATPMTSRFRSMFGVAKHQFGPAADDADAGAGIAAEPPADPNVEAAQMEISGLLDRMRSLTRTVNR